MADADRETAPDFCFVVTLVEAKEIPKLDSALEGGKADPYVEFSLDGSNVQKSMIVKNELNPQYNQVFIFEVRDQSVQHLVCTVMDKDKTSKDDYVGEVKLPVSWIKLQHEKDIWREIVNGDKQSGKLRLRFHVFTPGAKDEAFLRKKIMKKVGKCEGMGVNIKPTDKNIDKKNIFQLLEIYARVALLAEDSGQDEKEEHDEKKERFLAKLTELGVEIVIFDMDRTACKLHSGGVLRDDRVQNYIENVAPDFQQIVPVLLKAGIKLAVATFTDKLYYQRFPENRYSAGEDLVHKFLEGVFKAEIVKQFFVVGYFPDLHNDPKSKRNKSYHIDKIMAHFKIAEKGKVALFDDTQKNVIDARDGAEKVHAYKADPSKGFTLNDLLDIEV